MNAKLIEKVCRNTAIRNLEMRNENLMLQVKDTKVAIIFDDQLVIECVEVNYNLPKEVGCFRFSKEEVLELVNA